MRHTRFVFLIGMWASLLVAVAIAQRPASDPPRPTPRSEQRRTIADQQPVTSNHDAQNAVLKRYCVGCHNDKLKTGGLSLEAFDVSRAAEHAETSEKVIRKLQAGLMPPPLAARPQ